MPPACAYTASIRFSRAPMLGDARVRVGHRARGHTVAQPPQPAHRCGSTLTLSPADEIALGRTDVDALGTSHLPRPAVSADPLLVHEELRLLELADQPRKLGCRQRLLERIAAWREIALRLLRHLQDRLRREVENQIEALAPRAVGALEVDRLHRPARRHALAVRLALVEIDLVGEVDRLLRTGADTGVAAGADLEVDRILLLPLDLERAEPALDRLHFARPDGIAPLERASRRRATW